MSYQELINEATENIKKIISDLGYDSVKFSVVPAKSGFGDLSCNAAFLLAKQLKTNPFEISKTLSEKYSEHLSNFISKTEAHPSGYLNFFVNQSSINETIIQNSINDDYGSLTIGNQKTITVEHTSVNPNKALHIGHVRNIVIGDTVARIMQKAGFNVNILNYIDDSGLQVADIILGFQELNFPENPPDGKKFDQYCGDEVYVKTTEKYEENPSLEEKRKEILQQLEDGSSETAKFADVITKKVLDGQLETCWNLSVTYDCLNFESQIIRSGLWKNIFDKLKEMKLIEFESEGKNSGCWVIRGKNKDDDKVVVRSNGTATYIAKDIPYAAWKLGLLDDPFNYTKYEKTQPNGKTLWQTTLSKSDQPKQNFFGEKVVTVIDSRQSRLQEIITSLMGKFKSDDDAYVHLGYESVTLSPDTAKTLGLDTKGKSTQMSGRKGLYVNADSVLELLKNKTESETKKRNPDLDDDGIKKIATDVSIATIRYEMIKQDLDKIITFDISKSLSLEGDTAPYIQYSFARATRILEKAKSEPNFEANYELLQLEHEKNLVRVIGLFDIQVKDAANNFSPKVIAKYCYDLAVAFNGFYEHVRILDSDNDELINVRLCLVKSFMSTLQKALDLIGISTPSRM